MNFINQLVYLFNWYYKINIRNNQILILKTQLFLCIYQKKNPKWIINKTIKISSSEKLRNIKKIAFQ